jgi:hypothetical protein
MVVQTRSAEKKTPATNDDGRGVVVQPIAVVAVD